jgi:hypothetical protein
MKRILMLLCVMSLALVGVANAAVQKGNTELEFLGGWVSINGETSSADTTTWFLSAFVDYFMTKEVSVGGGALGMWSSNDVSGNTNTYGFGGRAKYHFLPDNQWVPYVGGQIFWVTSDTDAGDADGTAYGPIAGVRYPLNEHNDFIVQYQWLIFNGDIGDVYQDAHSVFVAIAHWFKKGQ